MAQIQKQFDEFHEGIKLKRFGENATLREKRDVIIGKIKDGLKEKFKDDEDGVPDVEFIDQGSYAVGLGIIPDNGDYDIDEGIIFDLYKEDYSDPIEIKNWIEDIMMNHTVIPPIIKKPCVTITYSLNEEPIYHVDLPVYVKSIYDNDTYLAWGKKFSSEENRYWEIADPIGLNEYIIDSINSFNEDSKKQLRRVIRYIKKWKDVKFNTTGSSMPPSIGITIAACQMFSPYSEYNMFNGKVEYIDLLALKNFVNKLKNKFTMEWDSEHSKFMHSICLYLPVAPYKNIFGKMTLSQMTNFYNELDELYNALVDAEEDSDPHTACELLVNYFGEKFPVPDSKESRYQVGKSSSPSSHSA